jgi:hypothetical protein
VLVDKETLLSRQAPEVRRTVLSGAGVNAAPDEAVLFKGETKRQNSRISSAILWLYYVEFGFALRFVLLEANRKCICVLWMMVVSLVVGRPDRSIKTCDGIDNCQRRHAPLAIDSALDNTPQASLDQTPCIECPRVSLNAV